MSGSNFQKNIVFFCLKIFFYQLCASYHLGLHCLQKYLFRGFLNTKGYCYYWLLMYIFYHFNSCHAEYVYVLATLLNFYTVIWQHSSCKHVPGIFNQSSKPCGSWSEPADLDLQSFRRRINPDSGGPGLINMVNLSV